MVRDDDQDLEQRKSEQAYKRLALDFDRIELLVVAIQAFAQPVPSYEPRLDPRFVKVLRRNER